MKSSLLLVLCVVIWACLIGPVSAQDSAFVLAPDNQLQVTLQSVNGGAAFGTVGLGTAEGASVGKLVVTAGFDYLQPFWSKRNLSLTVPANNASAILGASGDLTNEFAFVPRILLGYQINDQGLGFAASGEFIHLTGDLSRKIVGGGFTGSVTANNDLTFIVANLVEATLTLPLQDLPLGDHLCDCALLEKLHLEDTTVGLALGTRFSSIRQTYQAKLLLVDANNDNSTVGGEQDFVGFGVTSAVSVLHPLDHGFSLFSDTRGSVLIGPNHKISTATANVAGGATSISIEETRTDVIPVGELEFGVEWGKLIGQGQPAQGQVTGTLVWVRAAAVGQIWGSVGLLSATNNNPSFRERPLYLAGFSLMFGLER